MAQGLEANGYTVWYSERDSISGLSYLVQTRQAIEQSGAVVLVISAHSLDSNNELLHRVEP
ncbi:MAG: toll/interleukin-1 receptor domain-containing protein [Anaerolineae bacterium]